MSCELTEYQEGIFILLMNFVCERFQKPFRHQFNEFWLLMHLYGPLKNEFHLITKVQERHHTKLRLGPTVRQSAAEHWG